MSLSLALRVCPGGYLDFCYRGAIEPQQTLRDTFR